MMLKKRSLSLALYRYFAALASLMTPEVWAQTATAPLLQCPGFFQQAKVTCKAIGYFYDQYSDACVFLYEPPRNVDSQLSGLCPRPCIGRVTSPETLNIGRAGYPSLTLFNTCGEVRKAGRCPEDGKIPLHEADYTVSCQKVPLSATGLAPYYDD